MFRRKSETDAPSASPATPAKPGGKGRPTPTRKEAEAAAKARARAPRDKKEMARLQREHRAEQSKTIRQGMKSGDEKYFLPRDKGPVRRFIRDYVDARFSIVEMVIPLMILMLVLGWSGSETLAVASSLRALPDGALRLHRHVPAAPTDPARVSSAASPTSRSRARPTTPSPARCR
ncbi:DUF3043 domain-containing protein [Nocardioides convexus]|uniref:DUF3043 domain-containing protein n=1 Tax=Nocardioides convexus TaxID=2712224 RepID=UPI00241843B5|nr:DUF3043 domain-containing protein [Nocardioides convexus]